MFVVCIVSKGPKQCHPDAVQPNARLVAIDCYAATGKMQAADFTGLRMRETW